MQHRRCSNFELTMPTLGYFCPKPTYLWHAESFTLQTSRGIAASSAMFEEFLENKKIWESLLQIFQFIVSMKTKDYTCICISIQFNRGIHSEKNNIDNITELTRGGISYKLHVTKFLLQWILFFMAAFHISAFFGLVKANHFQFITSIFKINLFLFLNESVIFICAFIQLFFILGGRY